MLLLLDFHRQQSHFCSDYSHIFLLLIFIFIFNCCCSELKTALLDFIILKVSFNILVSFNTSLPHWAMIVCVQICLTKHMVVCVQAHDCVCRSLLHWAHGYVCRSLPLWAHGYVCRSLPHWAHSCVCSSLPHSAHGCVCTIKLILNVVLFFLSTQVLSVLGSLWMSLFYVTV